MLAFLLGITMEQHWEFSHPEALRPGTTEPQRLSWSRRVGRARLGSLALLLSSAALSPSCVCSQSHLAGENVYLDKQRSQLQVLTVVVLQGNSSETYGRDSPGVTHCTGGEMAVP